MKTVIIIPARYASTRLPGKLLLEAGGKPILQHTYERACRAGGVSEVIIAADDERIMAAARGFGAAAVMTSPAHRSGSERVAEAARGLDADIIVNLQGDEPEIDPANIERLIAAQTAFAPFASTLACPFPDDARLDDPSAVKAIFGKPLDKAASRRRTYEALYFTRALAPHRREGLPARSDYFLHIGIYAFRRDSLQTFAAAPCGRLEAIEQLEQLRILEMGEAMTVSLVDRAAPGVDTPEDLEALRKRLARR